jgi:hypothetical protein
MRVALISFCPAKDPKTTAILRLLSTGSESRGNQVELFNGFEDLVNTRLTAFEYIAVVARPVALFGGKIPVRVTEYLGTSGSITGKKGCAIILKKGFSSGKACKNLMRAMEAEGVKLDYFDILADEQSAQYIGKKIG